MKKVLALASLFALTVAFAFGTGASAQYPPPSGSLTVTASSTTEPVGGNDTLTCTVRAADGTGIANTSCTFTIVSEPGGPNGDAAVGSKTITKTTDANGVATDVLRVGSTPGVIVVGVQSGGLQSSVIVTVTGASGGSTASPPASNIEGNTISPPSTGDAGLKH